ncbi:MAG: hypothetical protein NTV70_17225 [Acidobacteria bacterium]|nr:hypothetical protein [Acidobacteriota bacterium]
MNPRRWWWTLRREHRGQLAGQLRSAGAELNGLSRVTERDFLSVGAKLEEISTRARAEAEALAQVTASFGGDREQSLTQLLKDVSAWAEAAAQANNYANLFDELVPVVRSVAAPVRDLKTALRKLRVVGIMTRIESARLDSLAGEFEGLAEEVVQLTGSVEEKSDTILASVDDLCRRLRQTHAAVAGPEQRQREDLVQLVAACTAGIADLQGTELQMRQVSAQAHLAYTQMVERTGEIVMSLQLHDATRQRMEHISVALSALALDLTGRSPQAQPAEAAATVELQLAQLSDTRDSFMRAVHEIRLELDCLHYSVAAFGTTARTLSGGGESGDASVARSVSDDLSAVGVALEDWISSRAALGQAAGDADQACTRMNGFVQEIEVVGLQMLRLALNAQIHAVRLDESGSMMEAVAAGIGGVSQEASQGAANAARALRDVQTAATGLAQTMAGAGQQAAESTAAALRVRIANAIVEIGTARHESSRVVQSLIRGAEALGGDILSLRRSLSADTLMERGAGSTLAILSQVVAGTGATAAEATAERGRYARQLTDSLYTMDAERNVERSVTGGAALAPARVATMAAVAEPPTEFGDNIELF